MSHYNVDITDELNNKVDKINGKGLSTKDYTGAEKTKLAGIANGAEVNVQADWTEASNISDAYIKNKPTLSTVATSGSYVDLNNKPVNATTTADGFMSSTDKAKLNGIASGAEVNVQSDWNQATSTADDYIANKPVNATTTVDGFMSSSDKSKLNKINSVTTTSANILVADGIDFESVSLSVDASLASNGALTISDNAVDGTDIALGSDTQGDIMYYDGTDWVRLPAGTAGQVLQTNGDGANPSWEDASVESPTYTLGLNADLGGYVFYLTPDNKHGLVVATQDQSSLSTWIDAQNKISNPANHDTNGAKFTDWRLPTKYELNQIFLQRTSIGGFSTTYPSYYWSSTESYEDKVYYQRFYDGDQDTDYRSMLFYVRSVRAF